MKVILPAILKSKKGECSKNFEHSFLFHTIDEKGETLLEEIYYLKKRVSLILETPFLLLYHFRF